MITLLKSGRNASQTVTTTVLRVLGDTGWAGADAGSTQQRHVTLCVATGAACYFQKVAPDDSLAGSVSPSDYLFALQAGQILTVKLAAGETLAVVSAGSATVRATDVVEVD